MTFPEEGLRFLKQLKRNNNREWFAAHKDIYEESVRRPMNDLVEALAGEFSRFAPAMQASPKVSLYRIYRDTRFSKDKKPYKTHVAAVFPPRGLSKHEGAAFYFHISPDELFIGGGLYMPMPEDLQAVRMAIAAKHVAFRRIVENAGFRRAFGGLTGEQLIRVPRGFAADQPAAAYLRYRQYLAAKELEPKVASSAAFLKVLVETFRAMRPLIDFINAPILANRQSRQRQESLLR
jgi:uncharacterized protein (TIGR02453 family)